MGLEIVEHAERPQHVDRALEQGRRSRVEALRALRQRRIADERHARAGMGKRKRRRQARRPGADDRDVALIRDHQAPAPLRQRPSYTCHAGAPPISAPRGVKLSYIC